MKHDVKILAIGECKIVEEDGHVILKGYANNKNVADRYGDIPTVFRKLRDYVYELKEFRKNPVMLIDHRNSIENIAGSYEVLEENEKGLYFEAKFSNSELPLIQHAREIYKEGHAKALSIAGRWSFEDKDNPNHLTYAEIFEISLVAVPADPNALATAMQKALDDINIKTQPEPKSIHDKIDELKTIKDANDYLKEKGLSKTEREGVISKIRNFVKQGKLDGDEGKLQLQNDIKFIIENNIKNMKEMLKNKE